MNQLIQPIHATRLKGKLDLAFEAQQGRTVLHVREQTPPLKVIRAFDVNGMALVHLHNVSGGVLSGDLLKLGATVGPESCVQLTTTSATRLYRSRPDFQAAQQVDHFIAISTEIQDRIQRYYKRDSVIIYPPVDIRRFAPQPEHGDYYLIVSRLIP